MTVTEEIRFIAYEENNELEGEIWRIHVAYETEKEALAIESLLSAVTAADPTIPIG